MLNSNFNLRTFLVESKAPKEQIQEATLTEATVMEYIRERMAEMNNEVRSCMKEYLQRCNEIDPGHEDAHAQLMGALEDFYNKLKAHFEADAMEDPMPGDEEPPVVLPSDAPSRELDGSPMIEGEEEDEAFGGEEDELEERTYFDPYDELEEVKVKVEIPGQDPFEAEEGKEYSEEEADEYIKNAKASGATPMNTKFSKVNENMTDEEALNEALDPETFDFLMGLAKSAVTMGTVPAALVVLSKFKDDPKIAKVVTAFEKHLDK